MAQSTALSTFLGKSQLSFNNGKVHRISKALRDGAILFSFCYRSHAQF